jgi:hypothetical protein
MENKVRLQSGVKADVVFGDSPFTREKNIVLKDGHIVLLDRHSCAVFYRNRSDVCRLKDVHVRKDKDGYYVLI